MKNKKKKPIYKRWWFWALVVLVGLSSFAAGGRSGGGENTPATAQDVQTRQAAPVEDEPAAEPVEYTADADSLSMLLQSVSNGAADVSIFEDDAGWVVQYTSTGATWDETDLLRKILSAYIDFCRSAYEIDGVEDVLFYVSTEGKDDRGNDVNFQVFNISMGKEKFVAYNWDAMKARSGSYEQIESDCDVFWIHPGVLNSANLEKVYYA